MAQIHEIAFLSCHTVSKNIIKIIKPVNHGFLHYSKLIIAPSTVAKHKVSNYLKIIPILSVGIAVKGFTLATYHANTCNIVTFKPRLH